MFAQTSSHNICLSAKWHSLDTLELNNLLKNVKGFKGVFAADELPCSSKWPCVLVLNTDPASKPGEHWVAIFISKTGVGKYFDSFGLPPSVEHAHWLDINCKSWTSSNATLQEINTVACGYFCAYYLLSRAKGLTHDRIIDILQRKKCDDAFVFQVISKLLMK